MNTGEPLPAGHMLDGRYRIDKVIGAGGMGRVYLSSDTRLANRKVAVKEMIVGDGVAEQKAAEDFAREARVLSLLTHPGIPNLYDNFVELKRHYLVMEFVAGGDLQSLLDKLGAGARLPEPKVLRWACQILDVLEFLHSQSPPIVYRDLKPANIMIDADGRAMLIDFGIARFLPPSGRGTQIGSVGYAPPEQYAGKTEPRSDLYALGATMHHLLSGRDPQTQPPFSFPPLLSLAPEVSAPTARTVTCALERDLQRRPGSAAAMRAMLPEPRGEGDAPAIAAGAAPALSSATTITLGGNDSALPASAPATAESPVAGATRGPSAALSRLEPAAEAMRNLVKRLPSARTLRELLPSVALANPAAAPPQTPSVSSTAKTSELPKIVPAAAPARAAHATGGQLAQRAPARKSYAPPPAPAAKLIAAGGGAEFGLDGSRMTIGRSAADGDGIEIDLRRLLQGSERVSRRHAEIIRRGADYFIRDLGSLNGTYIVGRGRLGRDQLYKLRDRDQLVLGGARLEFRRG